MLTSHVASRSGALLRHAPMLLCLLVASLVFVARTSSADTGDCTSASPCATLPYALSKVTPTRSVIVVRGGLLEPANTVTIDRNVYIDGNGVNLSRTGLVLSIAPFTAVTLDNLKLVDASTTSPSAATVGASASLRLYRADVTGSVATTGGTISAIKSAFSTQITCMDGSAAAQTGIFKDARINATNCQLIVRGSRFDMTGDGSVTAQGGVAKIENNVIVNAFELADSMHITAVATGSYVRFNTFVNSSGVASDGVALYCDGTPLVTSNIFAYGSMHPGNEAPHCAARYSLFDTIALPEQTTGVGNKVADSVSFFVDKAGKDFHLAASSPAKGSAEPGLDLTQDLEGAPRPSPAGSTPDIGAYEAP